MRFEELPTQQKREQFAKHVRVGLRGGCWKWTATQTFDGYGLFGLNPRTNGPHRAHVLSYTLFVGEIPEGQYVLHTCDNRRCVSPEHLYLGTHQDNMDDMIAKGRHRPRGKAQQPR